ncbi:MAG: hypothetical protein ACI9JN_001349 [Bacteroidia bacterium]|jgi:hypothetical protein
MTNLSILLFRWTLILVFILGGKSYAQDVEWSNPRKLKGSTAYTSVIGQDETGLYLLRFRNQFLTKNIVIERYRNHLGYALSKNITLKKSRLLYAELQDKGLMLLTAHYDRKGMQNEVRCHWYDHNINPIGKQRVLVSSTLSDFYDKGDFRIRFSNDRKHIMVAYTEKSDDEKRILNIHVFNKNLEPETKHRYKLDIRYNNFFMTNLLLDNRSNAFFLISQRKVEHRKEALATPKATVYWYNSARDELLNYEVLDSGKSLRKAQFTWDRTTDKINLTAFYSSNKENNTDGIFHFKFKPQATATPKITYQEFTDDFKEQLFGDEESSVFEDVRNFELLRAIPNTDGGVTIVAERSSISNETDITYINGMPTTMSRNIYNFDDVLVISLDSVYNIKWKYLINKSQSSLNDNGYYSSIVIANTRSHLYIIYNDRLRSTGDVMQYMFDADGQVSYKILVRSDNHFVSIIPSEAKQINYNRVILPVTKDRKFSLLKLDYTN